MKAQLKLTEIMTKNPLTVNRLASVSEVIKLLSEHKFDHLPVVDGEGELKGIISKTDLYFNALKLLNSSSGKSYSEKSLYVTKAEQIMTSDPVVVDSNQSVDYAIELLLQDQFHALPVVENGQVIGIITSKDILESIANSEISDS